jgi:hypothetical protein
MNDRRTLTYALHSDTCFPTPKEARKTSDHQIRSVSFGIWKKRKTGTARPTFGKYVFQRENKKFFLTTSNLKFLLTVTFLHCPSVRTYSSTVSPTLPPFRPTYMLPKELSLERMFSYMAIRQVMYANAMHFGK